MKTVAEILKAKGDPVVYSIEPSATVYQALALMAEKNVGALLVMEGEKVVGMISIGDLVKGIMSEQTFIIEQLQHYIAG